MTWYRIKDKEPLVSIIIPVYKVEQYLERCVRSALNQTYKNLEIILVDDGSPDNCPVMCDNFAKKDARVIVIHQENKGLGAARNAGLDVYKGEWVCFIDSDDWVEVNYVEELLKAAVENNCLMATCMFLRTYSESDSISDHASEVKVLSWRDYQVFIWMNFEDRVPGYHPFVIWVSLYNKKIIENNRFSRIRRGEDSASLYLFIRSCATNNSSIAVLNLVLYDYFQGGQSITRGGRANKNVFLSIEAIDFPMKYYQQVKEQEIYNYHFRYDFGQCIQFVCECSRDIPEYKKEINTVINRIKAGKKRAFEMSHPALVTICAKYNWNRIIRADKKYILYGFGINGKQILPWLNYFCIHVIEIWDISAEEGQQYNNIPLNKMHNNFVNDDIVILCSIEAPEINMSVYYEISRLGYKDIIPYGTLNDALKYTMYQKFLPFLFEEPV